jgi:hypothetical protein
MSDAARHDDLPPPAAEHRPDLTPLPDIAQPERSDSAVTYAEEVITPEYAAHILDNWNRNPRRLRKGKAAQYAADMASGNWPAGMGVVGFDAEGWLVDGQHRFAACVMSGVPFTTLVARGVSQQAIDNADRGFKRGVADILKGKGEINVIVLQAALSMCVRWDEAGALSNMAPTWPQMEQFLAHNPDIRDAVHKSVLCVKPPLSVRGSVVSPFAFRVRRIDTEAADEFLHQFHTGVGLAEHDAILRLREQFLGRRVTAYGRPTREHDLALMIKSWNAFIVGRPLRQLKWNRGGVRQEIFPYLCGPDGLPWPFPDFVRDQARRQIADLADADIDDEDDED